MYNRLLLDQLLETSLIVDRIWRAFTNTQAMNPGIPLMQHAVEQEAGAEPDE